MERLMNDNLLIDKNSCFKGLSKMNNSVNIISGGFLLYPLNTMQAMKNTESYKVYFGKYKLRIFSLETLRLIISIVEGRLKKGVHKDFIFYSSDIIIISDNLTVSLMEYVIYYYLKKYNIRIYITHGEYIDRSIRLGMEDADMHVSNGFFLLESGSSFILESFLTDWYYGQDTISDTAFYCEYADTRRCKIRVGRGPWDASVALSKCVAFLEKVKVSNNAINAASDVVGELVPNAVEHGLSECMIDIGFRGVVTEEGNPEQMISIIVYNFSEKLLWTDLYKKVFEDYNNITYKKERINTIKRAWNYHLPHFSALYSKEDFYNLMAFQKISGREGDRIDGGLGINTLIKNVQNYSTADFCYVLSGHGALKMENRFINPDDQDYIAFNEKKEYVKEIPDRDAVMKTAFYLPGVAYNLIFYFKEASYEKSSMN